METQAEESVIWKASPSQLTNFWPLLISLILSAAIVAGSLLTAMPLLAVAVVLPLLYALWTWLQTRCLVYELTTERIRLYEGVLNQDIDDVELYRVKDTKVLRPFWLRLFGLSNLEIESSDRSHPRILFRAVRDGLGLREKVRTYVEIQRDKKRVREVDFEGEDEFEA